MSTDLVVLSVDQIARQQTLRGILARRVWGQGRQFLLHVVLTVQNSQCYDPWRMPACSSLVVPPWRVSACRCAPYTTAATRMYAGASVCSASFAATRPLPRSHLFAGLCPPPATALPTESRESGRPSCLASLQPCSLCVHTCPPTIHETYWCAFEALMCAIAEGAVGWAVVKR